MRRLRVLIACSGLGRVLRGYETFAAQCFDALRGDGRIDVVMARGRGPAGAGERVLPSISRESSLARRLGDRFDRDPYFVEQATFTASLIPLIAAERPDVVYFSDWHIGTLLRRWRRFSRGRFRTLLSNGAPTFTHFAEFDHVQHLLPGHLRQALSQNEPNERHSCLPYGFLLPESPPHLPTSQRRDLRARLGLPLDRAIVLSVGVLDMTHKRHDTLIRACAAASAQPYLVMLGENHEETPRVLSLATGLLGRDGYVALRIAPAAVNDYYLAADALVLASINEGFGRTLVEATAHGLPCIAHDYFVPREVLGRFGTYVDMYSDDALTSALDALLASPMNGDWKSAASEFAVSTYSWRVLVDGYVAMLQRCAESA